MTTPLIKALIYGPPKSKKTWWSCNAAAHGFNVHLLNADPDGWIVLNNPAFDQSLRSRINVIDISDTPTTAAVTLFMSAFLKFTKFWYVPSTRQVYLNYMTIPNDVAFWAINPTLLTPYDLVIVDSLSAMAYSSMFAYALNNEIDLSDASKIDWEAFGWQGRLLSWQLVTLVTLPCHVIVTAHATVYEKRKTITNNFGKKEQLVEWSRIVPQSSSGPHALSIAKHFNEILFTNLLGENSFINAAPAPDRDGGSRVIAPRNYPWADLQPSHLAEAYGIKPLAPIAECPAFKFFNNKAELEGTGANANAPTKPALNITRTLPLGKPKLEMRPLDALKALNIV